MKVDGEVRDFVIRHFAEKEKYLKDTMEKIEGECSVQEFQFWTGRLLECQQLQNDMQNELEEDQ